jgi:hypothetical protein
MMFNAAVDGAGKRKKLHRHVGGSLACLPDRQVTGECPCKFYRVVSSEIQNWMRLER